MCTFVYNRWSNQNMSVTKSGFLSFRKKNFRTNFMALLIKLLMGCPINKQPVLLITTYTILVIIKKKNILKNILEF